MLNLKGTWFKISEQIRFIIIGSFNAGVSFFIYSCICFFYGEKYYQLSLILAWILSSFTSFLAQKYLVFKTKGKFIKQYLKCCFTWFFSYLINAFVLELLVKKFEINVYFSQILATIISAIFTYIMLKIYAFKKEK